MNIDYETELKAIADAQKRQKQADLEAAKSSTLNTIEQQQGTLIPTYQTQRQQANVSSQIGAKNFAEYLARRGQTNQGIAAQAELSRGNVLGNTISGINTQETTALKDFANQRTAAETGYQTNLNSAYNDINTNYMSNLLNARQQEQARQDQLKQQAFSNAMAIKNYNLSARTREDNSLPEGMTFAQNGTAYQVLNGKVIPIDYAVKTTTKQYVNQKQYDYNRQGFWLQPQAPKITFGTKKAYNMTPWLNQYDNKQYIIAEDIPLPISGNEKSGKEVITNAYKSGAITKDQLKKLTTKFGY